MRPDDLYVEAGEGDRHANLVVGITKKEGCKACNHGHTPTRGEAGGEGRSPFISMPAGNGFIFVITVAATIILVAAVSSVVREDVAGSALFESTGTVL
mgnify:CR=1 FL=1